MNYEPVVEVVDYYDGPRTGTAYYKGQLVRFRSLSWDTPDFDPDDDRFELSSLGGSPFSPFIAHGEFRVQQPVPDLPAGTLRPLEVLWVVDRGDAAGLQRELSRVLLKDWDPIGIKAEPECADEYAAYVAGVYRLLAAGASDREIAQRLVDEETAILGSTETEWEMLIPVTEKLRKVYDRRITRSQQNPGTL